MCVCPHSYNSYAIFENTEPCLDAFANILASGNLDFFRKCVKHSDVLSYQDDACTVLALQPECEFVYGGDVCDKGIGDLRLVSQLVALKQR